MKTVEFTAMKDGGREVLARQACGGEMIHKGVVLDLPAMSNIPVKAGTS
jgi:hypothetical protein